MVQTIIAQKKQPLEKYGKSRTTEAFNPIPTGCCHVTLIYGLIPPMAGRNRVKSKIASFQVKITQNQNSHDQNPPTIHP